MGNMGQFILTIKDAADQLAADPDTQIRVIRTDNTSILRFKSLTTPLNQALEIPAFPQESNLRCEVIPKRYRNFTTNFFTLSTSAPKASEVRALRLPKQWSADFTSWNQLSDDFNPLKQVLENSTIKVIKGEKLGKFTESQYDSTSAEKVTLAKAALLNLFAKLTVLPEPIGGRIPWFSFVDEILAIDRERFYAKVNVEMGAIVGRIKQNPDKFKIYENTPAANHFEKLKDTLPDFQIFKTKMFSVKTTDKNGNLQLTMAPAKDSSNNDVLLLDADLDENGDLLNHMIDAFLIHPFNGGTHPFDIHEYMVLAHPGRALGYQLV